MIKPFIQIILSVAVSIGTGGLCAFCISARDGFEGDWIISGLSDATLLCVLFTLYHAIKAIWAW